MGFGSNRHAYADCNRYSDCNCNSDTYSAANTDRLADSNTNSYANRYCYSYCHCYRYCHGYGYRYRDGYCDSHSYRNSDTYSAANSDRLANPHPYGYVDSKVHPVTKNSANSAAAPVAGGDWREMSEGAGRRRKERRSLGRRPKGADWKSPSLEAAACQHHLPLYKDTSARSLRGALPQGCRKGEVRHGESVLSRTGSLCSPTEPVPPSPEFGQR